LLIAGWCRREADPSPSLELQQVIGVILAGIRDDNCLLKAAVTETAGFLLWGTPYPAALAHVALFALASVGYRAREVQSCRNLLQM
jgi:hypothetical protein